MKLNCKVGDLAIVVNAEQAPNLGQIVEVLGPQTGEPFTYPGPGHVWQVRSVSGRKTLTYRMPDGDFVVLDVGPVPDRRLRPISGASDVHPFPIGDTLPVGSTSMGGRRRSRAKVARA